MDGSIERLNAYAEPWLATMNSAVVQSVLLFAAALVVSRLLRKYSAAFRFWLWQLVALKLLVLPFSFLVVVAPLLDSREDVSSPPAVLASVPNAEALPYTVIYSDAISKSVMSSPAHRLSLASVLLLVWLAFVVCQMLSCLRRRLLLSSLLRRCEPAGTLAQDRMQQLAEQLGIRRGVRLCVGEVGTPMVAGVLQPCVVLPRAHGLRGKRLDQVLLHELTHVKRMDLLWVWIPEFAKVFFFFHPLAYWVRFQANLCREMACDESVLRFGGNPQDYARTLLELSGSKPTPAC